MLPRAGLVVASIPAALTREIGGEGTSPARKGVVPALLDSREVCVNAGLML